LIPLCYCWLRLSSGALADLAPTPSVVKRKADVDLLAGMARRLLMTSEPAGMPGAFGLIDNASRGHPRAIKTVDLDF
jgi:hypothetical protein